MQQGNYFMAMPNLTIELLTLEHHCFTGDGSMFGTFFSVMTRETEYQIIQAETNINV